jgi:YVTN family beta-propeller protein
MESPQCNPIAVLGNHVFVANTPAGTVDVIETRSRKVVKRIPVGIDPVSVVPRPDGKEVWVANHVSDSVSVIDTDRASPTYLHVVATVQEFDPKTKATQFNEPIGIAFSGNEKAYVSLSSDNQIIAIDVSSRKVTKRLTIPAQEPRALAVHDGKLFVLAFESHNQTQLSGGRKDKIDGNLVTFDAYNHSIENNNVLSIGHIVDIVKHPQVPDRDLFVFDTRTDDLVATVDGVGTLLYGLAVDGKGNVYIAQTDARNDANGRSGTRKHGLKELENRAFLNRITRVAFKGGKAETPKFFDLEPRPPQQPKRHEALATPFAIQVTADDSTLIVSAAASDKLFTVDAASGAVLGRVDVEAGPRGIALDGGNAWVLNALANSVSLVDLTDREKPKLLTTIPLDDPTHPVFKRGRIAFNTAKASTTGTFSCASCHPDGHTDQLLWVLDTPIVTGGNQIMPRSTMPARGLRDTAPYHWDGIPGDPYGGIHSASINKAVEPNSNPQSATSSVRHLIDGGLSSTMHRVGDESKNDEGKLGELSRQERDDMAWYLLGVPYPPAPKRSYTDELSDRAKQGFRLFHIDGDHDPKQATANVCGNCHRMPFLVSTNTPGTGMDAPTWRGAQDRWLILPQGRLNLIDFDFYRMLAERGAPEREIWRLSWGGRPRFDSVWDMVQEMSTGFSGAFARQVTLNKNTASAELTDDLLTALEKAATNGAVVLECSGVLLKDRPKDVELQFRLGGYVNKGHERFVFTRKELLALAASGKFVGTMTARHGAKANVDHPQPAIWTYGPLEKQRGRQDFPILHPDQKSMTVSGRHFDDDAWVIVNGQRVKGTVSVRKGEKNEKVLISFETLPPTGVNFLQLQVPDGPFSNEFLFHVAKDLSSAEQLTRDLIRQSFTPWDGLKAALNQGNLSAIKKLIPDKSAASRRLSDGATPLGTAALHGHLEVVRYLLDTGVDPSVTNADGNTPLHIAAFLCREDVAKLLLNKGASLKVKNHNGETPIDVVSGEWNQELANIYMAIGSGINQKLDLKRIEKTRPELARLLGNFGKKSIQSRGKPDKLTDGDWPQFRGQGGSGVVNGRIVPPATWAPKENVLWKYETPGLGWSSPIVVGGKVFVTSCVTDAKISAPKTGYYAPRDTKTHEGEHRWTLFCLEAATGNLLWEKVAYKGKPQHPIHVKASYASETPVSDGERVYAYFGNVGLFCYDLQGELLWSKRWDVMPTQLDWGTGASPVLDKDRICIVNDNEKASFIVALNKFNGKEMWKTDRNEKSNWATPFVWKNEKRIEIVTCGKGKVRSYDTDGKLLWEFGGMSSICVPSPVVAGNLLIISSGYEFARPRPVFAVKPGASGDISLKKGETSNESIAWFNEMAGAYHPTPLVLGDRLYVLYSTGFIACFEVKTGKPVYEKQRLGGSFTASPWSYDGKVFCLSEEGTTYVVKDGNEFELLGKNVLGEVALATPAVADGKLYLRTRDALYCIGSAKELRPPISP